jgi:hypothetical protein
MKPITITRIKRKLIRTFFREQWSLLLCDPDGRIRAAIVPPKDYQWADPFIVEHGGKAYIFIEQQIKSENGTLGVIELYPDLTYSAFTPILEKNYHLSFPNVFAIEKNGRKTWYMIPETHQNKTIDLYTAVDFPHKWEYTMTLMDNISAVDTTVFCCNQKWWLWTSIDRGNAPMNGDLSLFYADFFPTAAWTAHPQNPMHGDLRNSRMAGAIICGGHLGDMQEKLFRPAQDCLKDYGKNTNINEIVTLTPDSYKERLIKTIAPERALYAVCTHTINYSEHYMVRDIKTRRLRLISE